MPLILASGGLDSITLTYALHKFPAIFGVPADEAVQSVIMDFGQVSFKRSVDIVRKHHKKLGLGDVHVLQAVIPLTKSLREGPMFNKEAEVTVSRDAVGEDYVNGRNTILMTQALCLANTLGLNLWTGLHLEEERGPTDRTEDFLNAFKNLIGSGAFEAGVGPQMFSPYIAFGMTKQEVAHMALSLGVPVEETSSCPYEPECGICNPCLYRQEVLTVAKAKAKKR